MHEERISLHPKGIAVKSDEAKVIEIINLLESVLSEKDFVYIDCLTALCVMAVEIAKDGNITKPNLLANMSSIWETLEYRVDE